MRLSTFSKTRSSPGWSHRTRERLPGFRPRQFFSPTMKVQLRKPILKYGRNLLRQVHKGIGRASLVGDAPFFSSAQFPWATELENNWLVIREELDRVLLHREDLPNFQDISPDQKHLSKGDQWKTFFSLPTGSMLQQTPRGARAPSPCSRRSRARRRRFSRSFQRGMHIPAHRGPYKGVVRCHLGLIVPEPKENCRIRVADTIAHWEESKTMFFDDTYEHEVWNEIDGVRVVLFMDVLRPLSFPMSAIDRFVIKAIAASPFITDAKRNHEAWEQRMADIWR